MQGGKRAKIASLERRPFAMKVLSGTVLSGKVEIPAGALAEGERVMILAPDTEAPDRLSAEEEEELLLALEEIRRGEFVDGEALVEEIRSRSAP
jgi:hypothetical protein